MRENNLRDPLICERLKTTIVTSFLTLKNFKKPDLKTLRTQKFLKNYDF